MATVSPALRQRVRARADHRCEYCGIARHVSDFYQLQVEHVVARQHGGLTEPSNLAAACQHCNLHKGPNVAGVDPETGALTPLFNPRRQRWPDHFERAGILIVGRTDVGRTTVRVLAMNDPQQLDLRSVE